MQRGENEIRHSGESFVWRIISSKFKIDAGTNPFNPYPTQSQLANCLRELR